MSAPKLTEAQRVVHAFAVGAAIEVQPYSPHKPWRRARVERLEPYRGRPGYYVRYTDAKEQWESHGGWQPESCCHVDAGRAALEEDGK